MIDESPHPNESAEQLCIRLAKAKAEKVAQQLRSGIIIGCDQAPELNDGTILHKPGNRNRAADQLQYLSGKTATFHTGIYILDIESQRGLAAVDHSYIKYADLSAPLIQDYLSKEPAWQCAGAIMSEGLGISLLEYIRNDDPTGLIGLPLTKVVKLLQKIGGI